jgi:magnesium-transporting ATPase (P-type)
MTTTATRPGLDGAVARSRLARDGPNVLPAPPRPSAARELAHQLTHFFAAMLWVAGVLAIVADLPQLGIAIFVVVVVNAVFAFVQEQRADRATERLRDLLPRRVVVVRDGRPVEIDATGLVVDDLVVLRAGDRISADLRVDVAHGLRVDVSTMTGESVPVGLDPGDAAWAGTFVVEGEGTGTVTATGARTRLAAIAGMTRAVRHPRTPLSIELARVVRVVATIAVGVGAGFFVLALLLGTPGRDGFLFAIGVTVALVPEGLLPTVTLSLAIGAQRMAARQAIVRRLESVETLGSTTFVCTDKTGTLTENRMTAVEAWTPGGVLRVRGEGYEPTATLDAPPAVVRAVADAAVAAVLCSSGRVRREGTAWVAHGDPTDAALHVLALRTGGDVDAAERARRIARRFPFDPRRRRMAVVAGDEVLVKGGPESVLPCCRPHPGASEAVDELAARGLRVVAVATRLVAGPVPETAEDAERDLELRALVGLEDPPRAHAAAAVAACRRAGMRVAMVTGDHPATAAAIAREVGLLPPDGVVVEGRDLPDDDALLGALVDRDGIVCARVEPEQKLRIARALRGRGHVVAMTGDGVNDGPALREADIGVAMGRAGTDVAREAADLVLLDDDFATIVAAVEQGRAAFTNVQRFLTYHLTDNVAELTPFVVWALSGGRFPLALGVLQILALDIGTDTLPAVALGAEPPGRHTLERPPARGRLLDRHVVRRAFGVLGPTEALVEMAAFLTTFVASGWRPGDAFPGGPTLAAASGAAFAAVVLAQAANVFACRSRTRTPFAIRRRRNPLLLAAVAVELATLAAFLWLPPLADLLDHAPPALAGALVALIAPVAVLAADAADKRMQRDVRPWVRDRTRWTMDP